MLVPDGARVAQPQPLDSPQLPVPVSHDGFIGSVHCASLVQPMHVPADASHTGFASAQSVLARHSTHEPPGIAPVVAVAHTGVGAAHSVFAVQPRHVSAASVPVLSHTGVAPEQPVLSRHATHSPVL